MDQKANSVADMAFVLGRLGTVEERGKREAEKEVGTEKGERIGLQGEGTGAQIEVLWRDVLDAEYAETWSGNVVHGLMQHRVRIPKMILAEEFSTEEEQTPKKLGTAEEGKNLEKLTL